MKLLSPSLPQNLSPAPDFSIQAAHSVETQEPLSGLLVEHALLTGADLSGLTLEGARCRGSRFIVG